MVRQHYMAKVIDVVVFSVLFCFVLLQQNTDITDCVIYKEKKFLIVLAAGKSKVKGLTSGESLLALQSHGRR